MSSTTLLAFLQVWFSIIFVCGNAASIPRTWRLLLNRKMPKGSVRTLITLRKPSVHKGTHTVKIMYTWVLMETGSVEPVRSLETKSATPNTASLGVIDMPWDNEATPFFPPQPAEPSFGDILGAAFARENSIGSAITAAQAPMPSALPDPSFDPWQAIEGTRYEPHARLFVDTNSPEDVNRVKARIDAEDERARLIYGSTTGILASLAAGILDPINLIPIGGAGYRAARTGARIAEGAARLGAGAALGQAAQEAGLQATQLTRPLGESALNVAGAAVIGGVLGGAVGALRRPLVDVAADLDNELDALGGGPPAGGSAGAAAARATTLAQERLVGERAMTLSGVTRTAPGLRLATSPLLETRQLARELIEVPLVTRAHQEGIAEPIAAERLSRMWDAPLATALQDGVEAFVKYRLDRARALGDRTLIALRDVLPNARLAQGEFSEAVGRAMRRGDTHSIPEVEEAARGFRALFEKLRVASVQAGLLDPNAVVTTAQSYLPRVYLRDRIRSRRPEFQGIVTDWLSRVHPTIDRLDLRSAASEITDSILGVPSGRVYFPEPIKRGPLKDRTFLIPDLLIEDFLESDIRRVAKYAVRTVAPDLALQRRFGTTRAEEVLPKITEGYDRLRAEAEAKGPVSAAASRRLEAQRDADVRDFMAMWETVRGTYGSQLGADIPQGAYAAFRDVNAARLLGGMTLAAIPDLARAVAIHGMRAFGPLPHVGTEAYRLAAKEAQLAGTALDRVLSTRVAASFGNEDLGLEGRLGRALAAPAESIGTLSGMNLWNEKVKGLVGIISQNRIFEAVEKIATNAPLGARERTRLASLGIDDEMARRIHAEFEAHGTRHDGLAVARTERWTDGEATEAFRAALAREADVVIVTPGAGDRPLWMIGRWGNFGKMLGQFQSFVASSMTRVALAGLQQGDARIVGGFVGMMALGAMSFALKELAAGRLPPDPTSDQGWRTYVAEGMDRSGIFAWLFNFNNMAEKMTGGTVGVRGLLGAEPSTKYVERNLDNLLLGPTWDLIEQGGRVAGDLARGDVNQGTVHAMRKMAPLQNLFFLRTTLDKVEEGLGDMLGLRKTRRAH